MDELLAVLTEESERNEDGPLFTLTNTGVIIRIEASTKSRHSTASEAFTAAQEFARRLIAARPQAHPINAADIGAKVDPLEDETDDQWRGTFLLRLHYNDPDPTVISGLLD